MSSTNLSNVKTENLIAMACIKCDELFAAGKMTTTDAVELEHIIENGDREMLINFLDTST
jgi:hypothetical protein